MGDQTDRLLTVLHELNARLCERPDSPFVFLEYAAHLEPAWFVELAEKLQDAERVSVCIDIGHLGLKQASARFARRYSGLNLRDLSTGDARLPELAAYVQDAVGGAVGDVIDVIRSIGQLGKRLHFHLHDAHPLIQGLSDHFSFLIRLPIPFSYQGRRSLSMMYGPGGLAAILSAAIEAGGLQQVSFTLEIHQVEGQAPARRRVAALHPLERHHECRTNELLALRPQRERPAGLPDHRRALSACRNADVLIPRINGPERRMADLVVQGARTPLA